MIWTEETVGMPLQTPLFFNFAPKQRLFNDMTRVPSVQITQKPIKLFLISKILSYCDRNYDSRSFGSLCRHYWVTFLIIPLVLLICLWLIKWLTTTSEMPLLFTLQNLQKLTKMHLIFFSESEIVQRFQNWSGFCCSSNETKTTEAVWFFFCNDLVYKICTSKVCNIYTPSVHTLQILLRK